MIWWSFLIPVIAVVIVAIKFSKRMNLVEYACLILIPSLCVVGGKLASVHSQTKDTEYWNTYGKNAVYEEKWDEEVPCSHPIYTTTTDANGNTSSTYVGDEHSYDVDYHPPRWSLYNNMGKRFKIDKGRFESICKLWSMRQFKDMRRDYHRIDGDAYVTQFDKVFDHTVPICKKHSYENKIQCSKSVFNFEELTPETVEQYSLFEYPSENIYNYNPILGHSNKEASRLLSIHNARNGTRKQLHMLLLVFNGKQLESGVFQESYWKGGNKNEFIVCVGVNDKEIKWTKVISWTEQETLKIRVAREIKEMKSFDAVKVVEYMADNIPKEFIRKEFADFSYIRVEPTMKAVVITYLMTLILTIVIATISVLNKHGFGTFLNRGSRRNRFGRRTIRR